MAYLFSVLVCLCLILINPILALQNENNSNLYSNAKTTKYFNKNNKTIIYECILANIDYSSHLEFLNFALCILENYKNNTNIISEAFESLKNNIPFISSLIPGENGTIITSVLNNSISNGLIDDIMYLILSNTSIIDNLIVSIKEFQKGNNADIKIIYENFYQILNHNGTEFFVDKFLYATGKNFYNFIIYIFSRFPNIVDLVKGLEQTFEDQNRLKNILELFYNMVKNYHNETETIITVTNFFKENINISDEIISTIEKNFMIILCRKLIVFKDQVLSAIKDILLEERGNLTLLSSIIKNVTLIDEFSNIMINIYNDDYLKDNLPKFIYNIISINGTNLDYISNFMLYLFMKIERGEKLKKMFWTTLQHKIRDIFLDENVNSYNITPDCFDLFNYTYLNYENEYKDFFVVYFKKFISDSTNIKGNFLTFDNCLNNYNETIKPNNEYIIYPGFVIGIVDETELLQNSKNSSLYYKYNFVLGYCFPYGFKNKEDKENNKPMCSKYDYNEIIHFLGNLLNNATNKTVNTFFLYEENRFPTTKENIYGIIGLLILGISLIIYFILVIIKNIIIKRQKNNYDKNIIIVDNNKSNKIKEDNKNKIKIKIIYPKWYQYLNEIFNIFKNGRELFNFSLNSIKYNNPKGITYIKGLIGISIIFFIFGQTFLALANLPTREYGLWGYYGMMINYLYIFFYIGYRYSPRILFSCSGYTLAYKYLCYIEQEQGFYFLKFVFLQSYKYILLFSTVFLFKYSIYYINIFIRQAKRPMWEVFQYYIQKESSNYFSSFFTFLFSFDNDTNEMKQDLIIYFYIPINEIVFFLLGTILISIGYKFKFRIDLIILILIFIIYLAKIIIFFVFYYPKGYLSTMAFYLVDHGVILISPIYNLTCFLIGMYFGLINYSIQKGITNIYKNDENKTFNNNLFRLSIPEKPNNEEDVDNIDNTITKNDDTNYLSDKSSNINDNEEDEDLFDNNNEKAEMKKINSKNNYNSGKIIYDENIKKYLEKKEYSNTIKQIPFLILPIKFANFHRNNKDKCFSIISIIIAFIILISLMMLTKIFIYAKLYIDENIQDKDIVSKLSFESIIPNLVLNMIYSLDNEIVVFIIQWGTFLLYFKQVEIIRSFLNHKYWSFFVKTYFIYGIVSPSIILFVFYQTETVIKLSIYNLILYSCIYLIVIFISIIISYSCYELPLKKIFRFILKGKEIINIENEDEDEEGDSDNDDHDEIIILKDKN